MESQLRRHRAWCDEVGSAERGLEVVERYFVGDVDGRQAQAPLVAFLVLEEVIVSQTDIKKITWSDSRWMVVVIGRSGRWDLDARGTVLGSRAIDERSCQSGNRRTTK